MDTVRLSDDTWIFDEGGVRFFLLCGSERAVLIDSGMQTHNAKDLASELTSLPIFLINTHADMDHIGSNAQFDAAYMHPCECRNYYRSQKGGKTLPLWDGDVVDLGGRPLRIIHVPGHTPGSIAILDVLNRRIFTGDPVQDGRIFMFGDQREMHSYIQSLWRLKEYSSEFDEIFPSHGSYPLSADIIPKLEDAAVRILSGEASGKAENLFGREITAYDMGVATFLCD